MDKINLILSGDKEDANTTTLKNLDNETLKSCLKVDSGSVKQEELNVLQEMQILKEELSQSIKELF